jgi:hypothetical protein
VQDAFEASFGCGHPLWPAQSHRRCRAIHQGGMLAQAPLKDIAPGQRADRVTQARPRQGYTPAAQPHAGAPVAATAAAQLLSPAACGQATLHGIWLPGSPRKQAWNERLATMISPVLLHVMQLSRLWGPSTQFHSKETLIANGADLFPQHFNRLCDGIPWMTLRTTRPATGLQL